jgi:shikimate dehydrogenase
MSNGDGRRREVVAVSLPTESYLVGLVGDGVLPSLSPILHEQEADRHGLRYIYRPLDLATMGRRAQDVGVILREAKALGYNAFNITHPCKQLVLDALDDMSDHARRLKAANTVLVEDGLFVGHNTDFSGFAFALAEGLPEADLSHVVLVGAGGAGSAVAYAVLNSGAEKLDVIDVDEARAGERADVFAKIFPQATVTAAVTAALPGLMAHATGVVQATPVGMHHHPGTPFDVRLLRPELWVADVIYRPIETALVRAASALGCQILDGGRMAVGQAADTFRLITGLEPNRGRMRQDFLDKIAQGS